MRQRRRQRGRVWRVTAVVEEAFDLFLDALANTLGVIMFIALMVVLFSAPATEPGTAASRESAPEPREVREAAQLLEEARALQAVLDQMPHEGDSELLRRAEELDARLRDLRDDASDIVEQTAAASDALVITRHETRRANKAAMEVAERRHRLERRIASLPVTASFVRVSRFREDPRRPILLLLAAGRLERAEPAQSQTHIAPGQPGARPVGSVEEARSVLDQLLAGISPSAHRIEIGVWSDSFGEYKLLERLLIERGFDLNPLPVPAGRPLEAGTGGIQ